MIKALKNRSIAIAITIVVALLSTFLGVRGSLNHLTRDVEQTFYDGIYLESEGYTQPSIGSQIDKMSSSALSLATLLYSSGYESESEAVLEARRELYDTNNIRDIGNALADMEHAVSNLMEAAGNAPPDSREAQAMADHWKTFESAAALIDSTLAPAYNSKVDDFYGDLSFIASLFSRSAPDYFRR